MYKPQIDGSKELLEHATTHLNDASDFDKRIAFISIDNSVELTIVTYLSLPKRISKRKGPTRKELEDAKNSFPSYLDLLERYASDLLTDIDLKDIEWFHRIRNQLYHNGNCITVDKAKLEAIAGELVPIYNEVSQFRNTVVHLDDKIPADEFESMIDKIDFLENKID